MVLLALGGIRALWLCEWPAWVFVAGSLTVLAVSAVDLARHARPWRLSLDADDDWHIVAQGCDAFSGRLQSAGRRDATSVVMVLIGIGADRRTQLRRLCIPVDSVSASDFSFLHLQLAFAHDTDDPDSATAVPVSASAMASGAATEPKTKTSRQ